MILSVSRRTDIPAFYFEWFLNRIKDGFVLVRNPMNPKQVSRIILSSDEIDCIVFWTKNPNPALTRLRELIQYTYYFHYTLNPYGSDIETNLPSLTNRLNSFEVLSKIIGPERVIWRYDPILLNDKIGANWHIEKFKHLASTLKGMTDTVVVSVLDDYQKIRNQMRTVNNRRIADEELKLIMEYFSETAKEYGMEIRSCAEELNLSRFGIPAGKCIDDERIGRLLKCGMTPRKDKNQREICGCVESVDIGVYNTCKHGCKYCYANFSIETVRENSLRHDSKSPFLIGNSKVDDKINVRKVKSLCQLGGKNISFFD